MIALTFIDSNKIKATVDWLQSDRSVAAATWGLVVATLLLVLATLFLYLDGRTKSKEQGARWKREDEFRAAESKPKAYVELGKAPAELKSTSDASIWATLPFWSISSSCGWGSLLSRTNPKGRRYCFRERLPPYGSTARL
jgi:hypothetical protein